MKPLPSTWKEVWSALERASSTRPGRWLVACALLATPFVLIGPVRAQAAHYWTVGERFVAKPKSFLTSTSGKGRGLSKALASRITDAGDRVRKRGATDYALSPGILADDYTRQRLIEANWPLVPRERAALRFRLATEKRPDGCVQRESRSGYAIDECR